MFAAPAARMLEMSTTMNDLSAGIAELEALLADADPSMRPILEQQIQAMRATARLVRNAQPAMDEAARHRPALSPELRAFFTPEQPAAVPVWLPDTLTRAEAHEGLLRCPPGASVYATEDGFSCAFPGQKGISLSAPHGLALGFFHATGKLRCQRFYENGLIRWSVEYHPTGGREQVGFYASREPKEYLEHGLHTRWSSAGNVTAQASFWAGVRHGWSKLWEDDGFPISATLHENGREVEQVLSNGERRTAAP